MERRDFIKNTAKITTALSLLPLMNNFTDFYPDSKPFFKLSLAQWSLHKAILETRTLSYLDFAKTAKELGFEGLEYVNALNMPNAEMNKSAMEKLAKDLKQRSDDHAMKNVLVMIDNEGELAAVSKSDRIEAVNKHHKWVDLAAALGCHSVRVNLFGKDNENDFNIWKETSADGLRRLSEYAARNKINVIVENHGGLSSDAKKLTEVIQSVNLSNCGTLPDFGNFCVKREGGERWSSPCIETYDKYKGIEEMMPFAKGVSAKSYAFDYSGNETTIDYQKMLQIVKDAKFTGFIGVEYEGNELSEIDGIRATRSLLLKMSAKIQK